MTANEIVLPLSYDFHLHPRKGNILRTVMPFVSLQFGGAVIMGNTSPRLIITAKDAADYEAEMRDWDGRFDSIMSIMLTRQTTPEIILEAGKWGVRVLKFIPGDVSTGSQGGVSWEEIHDYYACLAAAQKAKMIFSIHGEALRDTNGRALPDLVREVGSIHFIDEIVVSFPELRMVIEHASTANMIDYVKQCRPNVFCGLTAHHPVLNYLDVCDEYGNILRPHNFCRPIAKTLLDIAAVGEAMVSGNPRFIFGSDSAPHRASTKTKFPVPAGIFNPWPLCWLCEIFEDRRALDRLPKFLIAGNKAYNTEPRTKTVKMVKNSWRMPLSYPIQNEKGEFLIPFGAGRTMRWQIAG